MGKLSIAFLLAFLLSPSAFAQAKTGDEERVDRNLGSDHFSAGGHVVVREAVKGDLIAVGGEIDVAAPVGGDLLVAGGNVRVRDNVAQGLYAAGGHVSLEGNVGRNVRASGGEVEIGPRAQVVGNVSVAGGRVKILGEVKGYVQAAGGRVYIDAPIGGDVEATAGQVELGPNANIAGRLKYRGDKEIRRDAAAKVQGGVEVKERRRSPEGGSRGVGRAVSWLWTAGLMAIAALIVLGLPAESTRLVETLRTRFGMSLVMGLVVLACVPVAAVILLVTIIGIPIAVLAILAYFVLLLLAYVVAGIALGDVVLRRAKPERAGVIEWRVFFAMLGMFAVSLAARVPWIGELVLLAAILVGLGALALQLRRDAKPA